MNRAQMSASSVSQSQRGGGPMNAIAKNPVSRLLPSAAQPMQRGLPSSPKFIRAMDLDEMGQLSEIAKFFIFVALPGEDGFAQLAKHKQRFISGKLSVDEHSRSTETCWNTIPR